jgi:hypothetical protein
MQGDAAIKSFNRCSNKLKFVIIKLAGQLGMYIDYDEILDEIQERWISCYDIYEDDNQYMRYMFIVIKNHMRCRRQQDYRYYNTHLSPNSQQVHRTFGFDISIERGDMFVKIMNEIAEDNGIREENPLDVTIKNDFISKIFDKLTKPLHRQIFELLAEGKSTKQIAEDLGYTVFHINNVRAKYIWPIVKDIMEIPDKRYENLISSGRIFSNVG